MKNNKMRKTGSFFLHLLFDSIIRTIVVMIIFFIIALAAVYIVSNATNLPHVSLKQQQDKLQNKEFRELDLESIAGVGGSIEILNENFRVVYPTKLDKVYDKSEIESLDPLSYVYSEIKKEDFINENGIERTLIYNSPQSDEQKRWFIVLDQNLNRITSGGNHISFKDKYTVGELANIGKSYIYKYDFITKDKKNYTMIIYASDNITLMSKDSLNKLVVLPIILIVAYLICMLLFVSYLNNKVKTPLLELNKAMEAYSHGELNKAITYQGPNEFVMIGNTFNKMVNRLRKAEEDNKRLEGEKRDILLGISHDLKTPITTIKGYTKALADNKVDIKNYPKYFTLINQKTENLTELINMFHDYSKMDHPEFKMNTNPENLADVLREIIANIYDDIVDGGLKLLVEVPDSKYIVELDTLQFNRAIENIVYNSIKYNSKDTNLLVKLEELAHSYVITIADNGIGIDEKIANKIFKPFVIGDDSRGSKHGSGLGLAITQKIIEGHGGSIILKTSKNEFYKTSFIIHLPKA